MRVTKRKVLSLMLALLMSVSSLAPTFAEETTGSNASVEISGSVSSAPGEGDGKTALETEESDLVTDQDEKGSNLEEDLTSGEDEEETDPVPDESGILEDSDTDKGDSNLTTGEGEGSATGEETILVEDCKDGCTLPAGHEGECVLSNMLLAAPQAESVIYVSDSGDDNTGDGTQDNPFATLKEINDYITNNDLASVEIKVVGDLTIDSWDTPEGVSITLTGTDEQSRILFEKKSSSKMEYNISMGGALTVDSIQLDCTYEPGIVSTMKSGAYTIVANGNPLIIGNNAEAVYSTDWTNRNHIIGGALGTDLDSDPNVEIYTSLPNTYVVGGCSGGNLTGDITLTVEDATVQRIYGGGEANDGEANVVGDISITLDKVSTVNYVCGGGCVGDFDDGNADVIGDITLNVSNHRGAKTLIIGGGRAGSSEGMTATVDGNISITLEETDLSNNDSTIYGGGYGDSKMMENAKVSGDITIDVQNCYSYGTVYGGGNCADVDGNITINVEGENEKESPSIYGGGEGDDKDHPANVTGTVDITLNGVRATVCTLGKYGTVDGKTTVYLKSGGGKLKDTVFSENIFNCDARFVNWAGNLSGDPIYNDNSELIVMDGTFVATTLHGFPKITICDKGTLQEQRPTQKHLFEEVGDVIIKEGGTLSLLQDNEISGDFTSSGNLTTEVAGDVTSKLIVDGTVTSTDTASYTSTDFETTYAGGHSFLQTKAEAEDPVPGFLSTDNHYTVANRAGTDGIVKEWYLEKNDTPVPTPDPDPDPSEPSGSGSETPDYDDIIVTKVDEDGETITRASSFIVYKKSGGKILYKGASGRWTEERDEAWTYQSRDGKFTIYDLKPGTYYIEEIKAPDGYALAEEPLKVEVDGRDVKVQFENKVAQKPTTPKPIPDTGR